jgi:hypothetical protein
VRASASIPRYGIAGDSLAMAQGHAHTSSNTSLTEQGFSPPQATPF